jgi:PPOX class probable F420-dependent enzyme
MSSMDLVRELAASEQGLCVVATTRPDGSVHASVVNAGPMAHPVSGADVVAFVARGGASKVGLVRATGRVSITFRRQWQWAGVEGAAEIVDADDPERGIVLAELLRTIFRAAGGTHDDWDEFDRVMAAEARVGVLVTPERVLGNR